MQDKCLSATRPISNAWANRQSDLPDYANVELLSSSRVAGWVGESKTCVGAPDSTITPSIINYQQAEPNTFQGLGLIPGKLKVSQVFDLSLNKKIAKAAGLH